MKRTVTFVVLLTVLASPARPQGQSNAIPTDTGRQILLRLQDDTGRVTTLTVPDGGTGTYARPDLPTLRLTPILATGSSDQLSLSVALASEGSAPAVVQIEALQPGRVAHVAAGGYSLDVTWAATLLTSDQQQPFNLNPPFECCVVCEGIKTCACRVQASCGSCSAPNCDASCTGTTRHSR